MSTRTPKQSLDKALVQRSGWKLELDEVTRSDNGVGYVNPFPKTKL